MDETVYAQLYALEDSHWWFRGRRAVIRALLGDIALPGAARILDAGCGTGRNLREYASLGSAEGVDPSPVAVDFCRRRGLPGVVQAGLEALPFEADRFDLVCASDVLEHVEDDQGALRELRRVTVPHGRLLVTVPAYRWLWSHHDDVHHHFRRYTRRELASRAAAAGWRPIRVTYFNSTLLLPIAAVRLAQKVRPGGGSGSDYDRAPAVVSRLLEWVMRAEARSIRAGLTFPAGVSIGMVCARD